jgi:hypothetical protein
MNSSVAAFWFEAAMELSWQWVERVNRDQITDAAPSTVVNAGPKPLQRGEGPAIPLS